MADGRSGFIYVTYIRTTPEELWTALTTPEFTKKYWFGAALKSDWKVGAAWTLTLPDGRLADAGEVIELEPARRLVLRWRNEHRPELKAEGPAICIMELEPQDGAVKLTITHTIDHEDFEVHRRRLGRLAQDPVEPQVAARNRQDRRGLTNRRPVRWDALWLATGRRGL